MRYLIVCVLAFFLALGPAGAGQHAGMDMQAGHAKMAAGMDAQGAHGPHGPHGIDRSDHSACITDCDAKGAPSCCGVALMHCAVTSARHEVADLTFALSSNSVSFFRSEDTRARIMPEQETPPPRL